MSILSSTKTGIRCQIEDWLKENGIKIPQQIII